MITPEASRQKGGVTETRFSTSLIAGIRACGYVELCTENLRWESGIEAAVKAAAESGMTFDPDFILLDTAKLASIAGLYWLVEPSPSNASYVRMSLPTKESAVKYLEHTMPQEEVRKYREVVVPAFIRAFENPQ